MRLMTWNINSLRLRLPLLARLAAGQRPDIICLQETKVPDALFPAEAIREMGYPHFHFAGMKGYNGVAILSRHAMTPLDAAPDWCGKGDTRHIAVRLETAQGPIVLHDFYVPAGGDVPDPALNGKYAHKLAFLDEVTAWFRANRPERAIVVGDLNIAPLENDVWSHRQLLQVVSHTEPEIARLEAWQDTGFVDAMRALVPQDEKLYTWWSYRNRDWKKSDRGRRLDHVWITPDLRPTLQNMAVLRDVRDWDSPSDHVPVVVDLDLDMA